MQFFYRVKFIFQMKSKVILLGLETHLHIKNSRFENIYVFLSYTQKSMKKMTKIRNYEKRYNFETKKILIQNVTGQFSI